MKILGWISAFGIIPIGIFIVVETQSAKQDLVSALISSYAIVVFFLNVVLATSCSRAVHFARFWAYGIIDSFYANYCSDNIAKKQPNRT